MENADKSILLQFAKFSKGFRISDFDEFVEESIGVENLDFFGRLAYPNQWQMRLSNPDLRESLIRKGKTRIKNRSCWMYPLNQQEIRGFVHWLPNSVTNDELMEQLKLYGNVLFIESQERNIKGRKVESDPRYYGLILPHGTIKEAIPHFLKINGYLCHLAVRGRVPACFHCKEVGHLRAECPKYKAKLASYCNREPNTAPQRLKPRGRRHVKVETEVKDKTGGDEVSSSADIVRLEKEVPVDEETTEPPTLPILEDREHYTEVQEEAASSTEKELVETGDLTERTAKSCIGTSAASFSETRKEGIIETLQQIQRRTAEDLRQRFQIFGTEITQTLTRGKLPTYTRDQMRSTVSEAIDTGINLEPELSKELEKQPQEIFTPKETFTPIGRSGEDPDVDTDIKEKKGHQIPPTLPTMHKVQVGIIETREKIPKKSEELEKLTKEICASKEALTPIERSGEDSNVDTNIRERKGDDIPPTFPTMHEVKVDITETREKFRKKSEEMEKDGESTVSDKMRSVVSILEQTQQTATEIIQRTFKELKELAKSNETAEIIAIESAADTEQKIAKGEMQSERVLLEQTKQTASDYVETTFKKLEEEIASLSLQPTDEQTDTDTKLTKDDIQFAYQMLKQTKETVARTLENTFRNLAGELEKETESAGITTESSAESKPPLKIAESSTKSAATLKQRKQDALDIVKQFDKEGMKDAAEADNSEKQSSADNRQKETIQSESDPGAISQVISEPSEESEKEAETEKVFITSKGLESCVSKAVQEKND